MQILFGHFLSWAGVTILIFFKLCKLDLNDYLIGISLIFNSTILITHPLIYGLDNWKIDDENSPATIFEYVPEQNLNIEPDTDDIEPDEIRRKLRRQVSPNSSWAKVSGFWYNLLERRNKPGLEYDEYDYSGRGQENPTTMLDRWTKQQPPGNDDEQQELDAKVNDKDENDPEEEYSEQNPNADDTSLEEFAQRILMDDSINPPLSKIFKLYNIATHSKFDI
uniref:Uncharacterized protein n=1 Tax=Romanomermis culicivorax TaxID=13658 RepID=A0A915KCG8_ROMCU